MAEQSSVTAAQAEPKQSREERKLEKKFKSLEADCGKYRKKHNGEAPAFCEAVEEVQRDVGWKKALEDASRAGADLFQIYNDPKSTPEARAAAEKANREAMERALQMGAASNDRKK